jgi:hypothetical protein
LTKETSIKIKKYIKKEKTKFNKPDQTKEIAKKNPSKDENERSQTRIDKRSKHQNENRSKKEMKESKQD